MRKGISTIIAAIILVVITIGLLATAYLYFAGIVTVGPVVSIASAYCNEVDAPPGSLNVTVTLKNEGTSGWSSGDLKFYWEGNEVGPVETDCQSVDAGDVETCIFTNDTAATGLPDMVSYNDMKGTHILNVYGPRNTAGGPITC